MLHLLSILDHLSPIPWFTQAHTSLDRAIWCFEQAGYLELAAKARAHRLSIQYRLDVIAASTDDRNENDLTLLETKGAQTMEALVKEGLAKELMNVFYSINQILSPYAKEELEKQFISKIRASM